uniref:Ubiquitin hydrolase n=1 Tax=Tanacetum cinerariifolium TaxID=118510 RepID=A0A6L2NZG9_TANCI|nr:ubiquitin hydrolase [Tanacetum cinerariifolium]
MNEAPIGYYTWVNVDPPITDNITQEDPYSFVYDGIPGEHRVLAELGLHFMTPATSSIGLVSKPVSQQPCIPPKRDDWDRLFQPMFDEYFNPLTIDVSPVLEADAPRAEVLADSPVSISITQDALSTNPIISSFNKWYQSLVRSFDQEKNNNQAQQKKKMVKTISSSENKPCFFKACKKNTEILNSKITQLPDKLSDRENIETIRALEFKVESSTNCIESLTKDLELLKKTGPPEFKDDTVTDYSRPSPTIESSSDDSQNKNPSVTKTKASHSTISSKPFIKFVKVADRLTKDKTDKKETTKKPTVKYAELYKRTSKSSKVRGNQRNWNNLKSQQLGENFVKKNNACFNCGHFDHLSYDCRLGVKMRRACPKNNNTHKSMPPRAVVHKPVRSPTRTNRSNMNVAQPRRTNFPKTRHSYVRRPFQETTQDLMIILIQRVKMLERS